tara:strand:+ start:2562 stop:3350 length:789 start_codon:yes stop_codon:yes gene_type:complete
MSESQLDFAKKIAKANAARQRQLDKQKQKQASPEYQKAQQEKRQATQNKSQQRAFEKMKARLDDPAYRQEQQHKQRESQIKAAEKQRERQQVKETPAGYALQNTQLLNTRPDKLRKKTAKTQAISAVDVKRSKPIKSNGLKGRAPTALEKKLGNKIGDIGCICCLNKKWYTTDMAEQEGIKFVSLHHVEGRTKQWAHAKVLPLCAYHHDTPAPNDAPDELTAIHRGNKKEWVALNGTEGALLKQVYEMIDEERPWLAGAATS